MTVALPDAPRNAAMHVVIGREPALSAQKQLRLTQELKARGVALTGDLAVASVFFIDATNSLEGQTKLLNAILDADQNKYRAESLIVGGQAPAGLTYVVVLPRFGTRSPW